MLKETSVAASRSTATRCSSSLRLSEAGAIDSLVSRFDTLIVFLSSGRATFLNLRFRGRILY
jgi:hypothetical protein